MRSLPWEGPLQILQSGLRMPKNLMTNSAVNAAAGMLMLIAGIISSIIFARFLGLQAIGLIAFSAWLSFSGTMIAGLYSDMILMRSLPQRTLSGTDTKRRRSFASFLTRPVAQATAALLIVSTFFFFETEPHHWASTAPIVLEITSVLLVTQSIVYLSTNHLFGEQPLSGFLGLLTGIASGAVVYTLAIKVLKTLPRKDFESFKTLLGKGPDVIRRPTIFDLNPTVTQP